MRTINDTRAGTASFRARSSGRSAGRRFAFTLVELLVVIGIIALLISILLPALNSARRSANAVKCSAALREIGNCFNMYAGEYRGYLPPVRINKYEIDGVFFDTGAAADDLASNPQKISTNAFWFHFLAKYITKVRGGSMTNADASTGAQMQRTLIWGCPTFQPYVTANNANQLVGGVNRQYTGYGMNNWPTFKEGNPDLGIDFPAADQEFANPSASQPNPPEWYKITQYSRASERALAADSMWWSLESRAPNAAGDNLNQHNYEFNSSGMSGAAGSGQTNCDMYRHGKSPGAASMGTTGKLNLTGGKIAYNVLYADNHVVTEVDKKTIYKGTRMRFPQ